MHVARVNEQLELHSTQTNKDGGSLGKGEGAYTTAC